MRGGVGGRYRMATLAEASKHGPLAALLDFARDELMHAIAFSRRD